MTVQELKERLISASKEVIAHEEELTLIDSQFGDADHGLTMKKICETIIRSADREHPTVKELFEAVDEEVETLNGGSAVPLWSSWLEGIADHAPEKDSADLKELQKMFDFGRDEFDFMSGAKVGEKTIVDALHPATDAIMAAEDENSLFTAAAEAAWEGAMKTKEFTAKFGRAKSYGEKTLGTPDAGALSMAYFFRGLAAQ